MRNTPLFTENKKTRHVVRDSHVSGHEGALPAFSEYELWGDVVKKKILIRVLELVGVVLYQDSSRTVPGGKRTPITAVCVSYAIFV